MGKKFVDYFGSAEFYGLFRVLPDEAKYWIGNMPEKAEDAAIEEVKEALEAAKQAKGTDLEPLEMKEVVVKVVKANPTIEEICQELGVPAPKKAEKQAPKPAAQPAVQAPAQPPAQTKKPLPQAKVAKPAPQPAAAVQADPLIDQQAALNAALDSVDPLAGAPSTPPAVAAPKNTSAKATKPKKVFPAKALFGNLFSKKKNANGNGKADPNAKAKAAPADPSASPKGGKKKPNPKMFILFGIGIVILLVAAFVLLSGNGDNGASSDNAFTPVGPQSANQSGVNSGNGNHQNGNAQDNQGSQGNLDNQGGNSNGAKPVLQYNPSEVGPNFHRPANMYDLFRNPDWAFIAFALLGMIGLFIVRRERLSAQALTDLGLITISALIFTIGFYFSNGVASELVVKSTWFTENGSQIPINPADLSGLVTFGAALIAVLLCGAAAKSGKLDMTPLTGILLYMGWLMTLVVSVGAMQTMGMICLVIALVVQFVELLRNGRFAFSLLFVILAGAAFMLFKMFLLAGASTLLLAGKPVVPSTFLYFAITFICFIIVVMVTERFAARFVNKVKQVVPVVGKVVEVPADRVIDVSLFLTVVALVYTMINMGHL